MNRKNQIRIFKTFQFLLGIIFLFLSGCKTKFVESNDSSQDINKTPDKKSPITIDTTMNIIQAEYGVIMNEYKAIEKEPDTPLIDE